MAGASARRVRSQCHFPSIPKGHSRYEPRPSDARHLGGPDWVLITGRPLACAGLTTTIASSHVGPLCRVLRGGASVAISATDTVKVTSRSPMPELQGQDKSVERYASRQRVCCGRTRSSSANYLFLAIQHRGGVKRGTTDGAIGVRAGPTQASTRQGPDTLPRASRACAPRNN